MPISKAGARSNRAGVTLMEMMIVVTIIVLLSGIAYPSVASGIRSLQLDSAARDIAALENISVSRAARLQDAVELTISRKDNALEARSIAGDFHQSLDLGKDVRIARITPENPDGQPESRSFFIYPGGAPPAIGIAIENRDLNERVITLDPITGVPRVVKAHAQESGS
ncbi:MAG TPA: prepilin-type N-terminal cleavage/methylation domain-containing protein [Bryobacteraceae bacterium]|nr:prepilin-type N-terminal cleavage/methylation domain-containing protein [Bryobacteraceae bacterium]